MSTGLLPLKDQPGRERSGEPGIESPSRLTPSLAPVLDPGPGPAFRRLAALAATGHPVRTFLTGVVVAYVAVAGLSILLGLLVTRVILADNGIASNDESVVGFLSHHRSGGLTAASLAASMMAGGVVLPILVAVFGLAMATLRQWRVGAFLICALAVESASYRTTTLVIHRPRPDVLRLEHLPVDASYPSGHTAASIAVYCGLALLVTSRIASRSARVVIWIVAVAVPVFVAFGRMYRGMHHPLDVLGGVALGITALVALVLISRVTAAAVTRGRE
jgi:membrane-associated phospholipid phosphatase